MVSIAAAADLRRSLAERRRRQSELQAEAERLENELDSAEEDLGRAFAAGDTDTAELDARIESLRRTLGGIRRALPIVGAEIRQAEADLQHAEQREAGETAERLTNEAVEELEALDASLREWVAQEFGPRADRAEALLREAWSAEQKYAHLIGRHVEQPKAQQVVMKRLPGLWAALQGLAPYRNDTRPPASAPKAA